MDRHERDRLIKSIDSTERNGMLLQEGIPNSQIVSVNSTPVKTPGGGIPARSGTTLGNADCTIQIVNKSTKVVSDGGTINVLNLSDTAVAGSTYINAIRTSAGDYIADLSGSSSGAAVEESSTDPNTYGTTSFSTTTNQTKTILTGAANSTSESIFGTSGYRPQAGGTYHVAVNILTLFNATDAGSVGNLDVTVPEATPVPVHLVASGSMRFRLYIHDSSDSPSDGTLLDEVTTGGQYGLMPDDGFYFSASAFAWGDRRQITLEKIFGISQATLDALTGDEAVLAVEGYFERNSNANTGTATATCTATYTCTYIDSEFDSGDLIAVSTA